MSETTGKELEPVRELSLAERYALPAVEQLPPQWVIMGIQVPGGGVAVLASDKLTKAEMARRWETVVKDSALGKLRLRQEHVAVLLQFDGFQFIYGATYAEAMRSLSDVWQPPELTS